MGLGICGCSISRGVLSSPQDPGGSAMKAALFKLCRAFHRSYFGGHNVLGERRRYRRQTDKSKRSLFLFICGGGRGEGEGGHGNRLVGLNTNTKPKLHLPMSPQRLCFFPCAPNALHGCSERVKSLLEKKTSLKLEKMINFTAQKSLPPTPLQGTFFWT